jgi:hypothetical protein
VYIFGFLMNWIVYIKLDTPVSVSKTDENRLQHTKRRTVACFNADPRKFKYKKIFELRYTKFKKLARAQSAIWCSAVQRVACIPI